MHLLRLFLAGFLPIDTFTTFLKITAWKRMNKTSEKRDLFKNVKRMNKTSEKRDLFKNVKKREVYCSGFKTHCMIFLTLRRLHCFVLVYTVDKCVFS